MYLICKIAWRFVSTNQKTSKLHGRQLKRFVTKFLLQKYICSHSPTPKSEISKSRSNVRGFWTNFFLSPLDNNQRVQKVPNHAIRGSRDRWAVSKFLGKWGNFSLRWRGEKSSGKNSIYSTPLEFSRIVLRFQITPGQRSLPVNQAEKFRQAQVTVLKGNVSSLLENNFLNLHKSCAK